MRQSHSAYIGIREKLPDAGTYAGTESVLERPEAVFIFAWVVKWEDRGLQNLNERVRFSPHAPLWAGMFLGGDESLQDLCGGFNPHLVHQLCRFAKTFGIKPDVAGHDTVHHFTGYEGD